jgi:hypothetical protein
MAAMINSKPSANLTRMRDVYKTSSVRKRLSPRVRADQVRRFY